MGSTHPLDGHFVFVSNCVDDGLVMMPQRKLFLLQLVVSMLQHLHFLLRVAQLPLRTLFHRYLHLGVVQSADKIARSAIEQHAHRRGLDGVQRLQLRDRLHFLRAPLQRQLLHLHDPVFLDVQLVLLRHDLIRQLFHALPRFCFAPRRPTTAMASRAPLFFLQLPDHVLQARGHLVLLLQSLLQLPQLQVFPRLLRQFPLQPLQPLLVLAGIDLVLAALIVRRQLHLAELALELRGLVDLAAEQTVRLRVAALQVADLARLLARLLLQRLDFLLLLVELHAMLALHLLDFALQLDLLRLHVRDIVRELGDARRRVAQTLDRALQVLLLLPNPVDFLRLRPQPRLQLIVFRLVIRPQRAPLQQLREFVAELLFFLEFSARLSVYALHFVDFLGHFAKPLFVLAAHALHLGLLDLHVLQFLLAPLDAVQQRVQLRVQHVATHIDRVVDFVQTLHCR